MSRMRHRHSALIDTLHEAGMSAQDVRLHKPADYMDSAYEQGIATGAKILEDMLCNAEERDFAPTRQTKKEAIQKIAACLKTLSNMADYLEIITANGNRDGTRSVFMMSKRLPALASVPYFMWKRYERSPTIPDVEKMRSVLDLTTALYFKRKGMVQFNEIMLGLPSQEEPEVLVSLLRGSQERPGQNLAQVLYENRLPGLERQMWERIPQVAAATQEELEQLSPLRPWTRRLESVGKLKERVESLGIDAQEVLPDLERLVGRRRSEKRVHYLDLSLRNVVLSGTCEQYLEGRAHGIFIDSDRLACSASAQYEMAGFACFPWREIPSEERVAAAGWDAILMNTLSKIGRKTGLPHTVVLPLKVEVWQYREELRLLYEACGQLAGEYPLLASRVLALDPARIERRMLQNTLSKMEQHGGPDEVVQFCRDALEEEVYPGLPLL